MKVASDFMPQVLDTSGLLPINIQSCHITAIINSRCLSLDSIRRYGFIASIDVVCRPGDLIIWKGLVSGHGIHSALRSSSEL